MVNDVLFDLGNTRLKFAHADAPDAMTALAHEGNDNFCLPDDLGGDAAWVASVAPEALRARLLILLAQKFNRVHCVRTQLHAAHLRIAYPEPDQLGVDRFLSMLALPPSAESVLLVGVGTGLTVDAIAPGGFHLGGVIAPSPDLMRRALSGISTRLPVAGGEVVEFAHNTTDALASGCTAAAAALVLARWQTLNAQTGLSARCILHGGGAAALVARVPGAELEHAMVMRGLAVWRATYGAL